MIALLRFYPGDSGNLNAGSGKDGKALCYHLLSALGSRRERCGYRVVRRQRNSSEQLHCLSKAKKSCGHVSGVKELLLSTLSPEQLVLTLLEAEPPNVLVSRPSTPFTESSMMMSLTKLADMELVHMIGWAKKIPGRAFWVLALHLFVERPFPNSYGARVQNGGP